MKKNTLLLPILDGKRKRRKGEGGKGKCIFSILKITKKGRGVQREEMSVNRKITLHPILSGPKKAWCELA